MRVVDWVKAAILEALPAAGPLTCVALQERLRCRQGTLHAAVHELAATGRVRSWLTPQRERLVQRVGPVTAPAIRSTSCRSCRRAQWATNAGGQVLFGRPGTCGQLAIAVSWTAPRSSCVEWVAR